MAEARQARRSNLTSILQQLQAEYDTRARMAAYVSETALERPTRPKATRTYTGVPLTRRNGWGAFWATIQRQEAAKMYAAERT